MQLKDHPYLRPTNLADALAFLKTTNARVLAGGTDLYPSTVRQHLEGAVLDVGGIDALNGITRTEAGVSIGATTTWSQICHAELPAAFVALKLAAREVGSVQIQNTGTIAGNLCNASPAADGVPPLLVLDAEVSIENLTGERRVPLAAFATGNRQTCLADGDIVTAIHIPDTALAGNSAFLKLGARAHLVISIAMVAVRLVVDQGRISEAAIAVGACSPVAMRLPFFEKALLGCTRDRIAKCVRNADLAAHLSPIDDIRADGDYRKDAVPTLITRALHAAFAGTRA